MFKFVFGTYRWRGRLSDAGIILRTIFTIGFLGCWAVAVFFGYFAGMYLEGDERDRMIWLFAGIIVLLILVILLKRVIVLQIYMIICNIRDIRDHQSVFGNSFLLAVNLFSLIGGAGAIAYMLL